MKSRNAVRTIFPWSTSVGMIFLRSKFFTEEFWKPRLRLLEKIKV